MSTISTPREDMITLAIPYANHYRKDRDEMIKILRNVDVPVKVILTVYEHLTKDNSINKIEDLDKEVKNGFWKKTLSLCPGIDKPTAIDLCKCAYTLETINKTTTQP